MAWVLVNFLGRWVDRTGHAPLWFGRIHLCGGSRVSRRRLPLLAHDMPEPARPSQPFIIVEAAKILTEEQRGAAPLPHTPPLGHRPSHASTAYIFLLNLYTFFPCRVARLPSRPSRPPPPGIPDHRRPTRPGLERRPAQQVAAAIITMALAPGLVPPSPRRPPPPPLCWAAPPAWPSARRTSRIP